MSTPSVQCPTCGAGHSIHNPGVVTVNCEYCGNAIYWNDGEILNAGKQSILPEGFSRLYRGATGSLLNKRFNVMGRIRYSFDRGFWDEWFLEFEDLTIGWLTEDNHDFALQERKQPTKMPPYDSLAPGKTFTIRHRHFQVQERGLATCLGMEGNLPIKATTGEEYRFVDASSLDGRFALGIEYDATPPTLFLGKWLRSSEIQLDNEGLEW